MKKLPVPSLGRLGRALAVGVASLALGATSAFAAFGYTDDGTNYVIDTGALTVFSVKKSSGDIVSIKYRGVETEGGAQNNYYGSHIESGLGSPASITTIGSVIKVTINAGTLTHYIVARSGENNIYLFTYRADESVNAGRFVFRLQADITGPDAWTADSTVIEAGDIYLQPDGQTKTKHYSGLRTMDYSYVGAAKGAYRLWLIRSNHEKASGGPFYRSLLRGSGGANQAHLYEILDYSMAQSDVVRYGLQGPYFLNITDGETPASSLLNLNTAWIDGLGIRGWVGASGRGRVNGAGINGRDGNYPYTVGFSNADAQYWAKGGAGGAFVCYNMLPGTYAMTVYKGELAVLTGNVTVTAGQATTVSTLTITADPSTAAKLWRIGDWDGTPNEFKNGALMTTMHPSDYRCASWTGDFNVGTAATNFPCYQFKAVNDGILVYFNLTAAQAAVAHTLRIGITAAYAGGRILPGVNGWSAKAPAASTQPSSRCLTVGTYRENNTTYTFSVPATAFVTGQNILKLNVISGSTGDGFLSPAVSYDCIDFN